MINNFLRIALRQLSKHKVYSLINVFGLSLGICAFLLISLFVKRELSFDEFQSNKESIYQVYLADSADVNGKYSATAVALAGPTLVEDVPEVAEMFRFGSKGNMEVTTDNKTFVFQEFHYTDASTFELLDFEFLSGGAPQGTFSKKHMVISQSEAERLYGGAEQALGKLIEVPDLEVFEVTGVFKDLPANSHIHLEALVSFDHANELIFYGFDIGMPINLFEWGGMSIGAFPTYLKLDSQVSLEEVAQKVQASLDKYTDFYEVKLVRLDDIYMSEHYTGYFVEAGDRKELNLFIAVGLLLLIIAIVNYMNLSTARFSKRAKEVGVRKTVGGHRSQLVFQFMIESIALTFFALVVGVVLAEVAIPYFNSFTDKVINIDYGSFSTYLFLLATVLIIGSIAGVYPALYLSRFSAKRSLIHSGNGRDKSIFRKVLVGFQFAICLGLITTTFITYSQHEHMRTVDLGLDIDQVVTVELDSDNLENSAKEIKSEVERSPYIEEAVLVTFSALNGSNITTKIDINEVEFTSGFMSVEPDFMEMMDIEMAMGEKMTDLPESERDKVALVNEAFVRQSGLDNPIGEEAMGSKIIGVTKNFIYESARKEIAPLVIMSSVEATGQLYLKLSGNVKEALAHTEKTIAGFDSEYNFEYTFLDDHFANQYEEERRMGQVFGLFSLLTIFTAGLGILGLSIFIAESRIKEIGIRKVLGAKLYQVVWLLNSGITFLVLAVAVVTLPLVFYFSSSWLEGFAYRMQLNVWHFALPLLLLLGVLWTILFYQSYKSANANPVKALRTE